MEHLKVVLERISEHGLKIKVTKCSFTQESVALLGHVGDEGGVHFDSRKLKAIRDFPRHTSATELRSFLGIAGYYSRFIEGFVTISATLHAATSIKAKKFERTNEMEEAFETLNEKVMVPPVLAYPRFDAPVIVERDALATAFGAVLARKQNDGKTHPNQFASRTMTAEERK